MKNRYTNYIAKMLKIRSLDADPVTVEETMRARYPQQLDNMCTARFNNYMITVAREMTKGGTR